MAHNTLAVFPPGYFDPAKPFQVFASRSGDYPWLIYDTRNGSHPVSKHKFLELAILEAERLNRKARDERARKVLPFPSPVPVNLCSYDNGYSPDCTEPATVHVIDLEQDFCEYHYRKAMKGE